MQTKEPVSDREQRDGEQLAVGVADVLREDRRGGSAIAELRALRQPDARLADQAIRKPGMLYGRVGVGDGMG